MNLGITQIIFSDVRGKVHKFTFCQVLGLAIFINQWFFCSLFLILRFNHISLSISNYHLIIRNIFLIFINSHNIRGKCFYKLLHNLSPVNHRYFKKETLHILRFGYNIPKLRKSSSILNWFFTPFARSFLYYAVV